MSNNQVELDFRIGVEWEQGFTGKLDIINNGDNLNEWELEFEAPFEITDIWDAEIVSHQGNKYVIRQFGLTENIEAGQTRTITFNANKIDGNVVEPTHYTFNDQDFDLIDSESMVDVDAEEGLNNVAENPVDFDFRVSAEWEQGFTGQLDITNNGDNLSEWELEFEAPFEITNIWDAEIVSHQGNKYVIKDFGWTDNIGAGETQTVTFNANKVNGNIVEPANLVFEDNLVGEVSTPEPEVTPEEPLITEDLGTDIESDGDGDGDGGHDHSGNGSHLQVDGRFLYDANGEKVIMRGIENVVRYGQYQGSGEWNDPYEDGWLVDGDGDNVAEIAKTGANATRLIGGRPEEFERALEEAVENNLWVSIGHVDFRDQKVMETIKEYESYVTLHAQGETAHQDENKWREDSIKTIEEVRALGYKAPIEITAGSYGQRFEMILNQGEAILNSDPLKNVVFVTQAYSEIENRGGVTTNLDKLMNFPAPVLVGASHFGEGLENGWGNNSNTYKEVWDETYERDLGSFYWVWADAGYGDVVSSSGSFDDLTAVGEYLVNDSPANLSSHAPKTEFLLEATL